MSLWGGRFAESPDELLRKLNDSITFDKRMYAEDIAGSIAYAQAIADVGIISSDEARSIVLGLEQVKEEFDAGTFVFMHTDEDIHTAVERRLTELIGEAGRKLHTGRSRNDQVATDFRLWVFHAVGRISSFIEDIQVALLHQAEQHLTTLMPGYTHFQPAQPITAAHWLMSFFWMLARDRERLSDAHRRLVVMPLGSGALAGTPFPINRERLADDLGFASCSLNSLDAVSDRDFVAETLFCFVMIGTHLSRLAEDIVIYSNPALGFITLSDRYTTGSSLMPQKRNPDPMELVRGKVGRLIGHLCALLTTLKGLPSGYNKDLQEDKEAMFDSVDTLTVILPVVRAIITTLIINPERMRQTLTEELLATDLADFLVNEGLPFRDAHHIVGLIVRMSIEQQTPMSQLPLEMLKGIYPALDERIRDVFDFEASVRRRSNVGGTAPEAVERQIEQARAYLQDARRR